jgi:hypothetical protein
VAYSVALTIGDRQRGALDFCQMARRSILEEIVCAWATSG